MPTRDEAWALLCEWTQSEALRKHGRAVEGAVGWYAQNKFGKIGDELETWRSAGLLHDFDYERFPDEHPLKGADELRGRGYPEELVQAVLGPRRSHRHPARRRISPTPSTRATR